MSRLKPHYLAHGRSLKTDCSSSFTLTFLLPTCTYVITNSGVKLIPSPNALTNIPLNLYADLLRSWLYLQYNAYNFSLKHWYWADFEKFAFATPTFENPYGVSSIFFRISIMKNNPRIWITFTWKDFHLNEISEINHEITIYKRRRYFISYQTVIKIVYHTLLKYAKLHKFSPNAKPDAL